MPQAPTVAIPTRIPIGEDIDTRDSSLAKDALLVNCYIERDKDTGTVEIFRRPGTFLWLHPTGFPFSSPSFGGGIFQSGQGLVYYTFGGVTYEYHNPTTPLIDWGTQTTYIPVQYNFVQGGKPGTVVGNGANAYLIDLTQAVTGPFHTTDSNYPAFTSPGFSYLDGTLYVMQSTLTPTSGGAVVYGSKINSVDASDSWDPLNFLTAQMTPEGGIFIAKQLGYVVVLKEASTEFFYDAGNATGSPLAPAENLFFSYGCADPNTVQKIGEVLVWASLTRDAQYKIVFMENTRPQVVSTAPIERILNGTTWVNNHVYSWHLVTGGHTFYGITLKDANITLVYDFGEKVWYQWTDHNGNYIPIVSVTGGSGIPFLAQHETNGSIYIWSTNYVADYMQTGFVGQSIPITIRTSRWDGNTLRKKQLNWMGFVGDVVPGKTMTVQWSDDDYQTYNTPQIVDLGLETPILVNCGSFRRRSWLFQNNDFLPFRMEAVEIQVDLGTL